MKKGLLLSVEVIVFNSVDTRRPQGGFKQVTAKIRSGHLGRYFSRRISSWAGGDPENRLRSGPGKR